MIPWDYFFCEYFYFIIQDCIEIMYTSSIRPPGIEVGIFWKDLVNIVAVDALVPCVARSGYQEPWYWAGLVCMEYSIAPRVGVS